MNIMTRFQTGWLLVCISFSVSSEVVFDGSTGAAGSVSGPAYLINEADGLISGNTLVHSFSAFSLAADESATFTGSSNINLVLNRVTGPSASTIDGHISSQMINADFYFLNPNGVIFGNNASIDVPGTFVVSTASRLSSGSDLVLDVAGDVSDGILTISDPENLTFVFGSNQSSISMSGADINHSVGDLSFISNDISITESRIGTVGGTLSLVASNGDFTFNDIENFSSTGNVEIIDSSINIGSQMGGAIRIVGGELVFDGGGINLDPISDSTFKASGDIRLDNAFNLNAEVMRSSVDTAITFNAENISILNGSVIETDVSGGLTGGLGTDLVFSAVDTFELVESDIFTRVGFNAADSVSGDVIITASNVILDGVQGDTATSGVIEAQITGLESSTMGAININAESLFHIKDGASIRHVTGTGGTVNINANEFRLTDSANGLVFQYGEEQPSQIEINAQTLHATDSKINNRVTNNSDGGFFRLNVEQLILDDQSSIITNTFGTADGVAIEISADTVELNGGSFIATNTLGSGSGGDISIQADKHIALSGSGVTLESSIRATTADLSTIDNGQLLGAVMSSNGFGTGLGGTITLDANEIVLGNGALITSFAAETDASVIGRDVATGNAGDILLNANRLDMSADASIETLAEESAGGNIDLQVRDYIGISDSQVVTEARGISSANESGNISIDTKLLLLKNATINANAGGGNAGNIQINADYIFQDSKTAITASSNKKVDGDISIDDLTNDVSALETIKIVYSDVTSMLSQRCNVAQLSDRSSFVVSGGESAVTSPDGYQSSDLAGAFDSVTSNDSNQIDLVDFALLTACRL